MLGRGLAAVEVAGRTPWEDPGMPKPRMSAEGRFDIFDLFTTPATATDKARE